MESIFVLEPARAIQNRPGGLQKWGWILTTAPFGSYGL